MGKTFKGRKVRIKVGSKAIYHSTECSISVEGATQSIATKDTNGNLVVADGYSWSMTTNTLVAEPGSGETATHTGFTDVLESLIDGDEVTVQFTSDEEGSFVYSGKAYVTNASATSSVGNAVSGNFTFTGTGDLTISEIPVTPES